MKGTFSGKREHAGTNLLRYVQNPGAKLRYQSKTGSAKRHSLSAVEAQNGALGNQRGTKKA